MRKEKRIQDQAPAPGSRLPGFLGLVFAAVFLSAVMAHDAMAQTGDRRMGTRSGQAEISRDPATGDLTIATPDPKPQDQDQGPRTVIVAPEVFLDRPSDNRSGNRSGNRPGERPGERPGRQPGTGAGTETGTGAGRSVRQ